MDIFDFKTGSLYAVLALASSVYLFWGFTFRLRPMLKAVLAFQILGDLVFFNWVVDIGTYRFVRTLSAEDRILPLLELMACVFAMDVGALLINRLWRTRQSPRRPANSGRDAQSGANRQNAMPMKLNAALARRIGLTLIIVAIICKVLEMIFSGILSDTSFIVAILSWQPGMSSGFTFLETLAVTFAPLGAALLVMHSKKKTHLMALLFLVGFGIMSPWKGSIVTMGVAYALMVYQFGASELRRLLFSRTAAAIGVAVLLYLPIKGQFRGGAVRAEIDVSAITDSFVGTTSAYAMGGVFQTYVYVMNSLERGYPTMGGKYNAQVLYLWVPRLLWPNKPDIAAEDIYYYLELTRDKDEPYGTAFAITIFGTFILDFGFWGGLISSLLLGTLLSLGERGLARLRKAHSEAIKVYAVTLSVIWLYGFHSLALAGVPPAFTGMLLAAIALAGLCFPLMGLSAQPKVAEAPNLKTTPLPGRGRYSNLRAG